MITLTGTLRQFSATEYEGKKKTKIWVEHTAPRDNGPDDLKLEELFLDGDLTASLPTAGRSISVQVRPYALGKSIKFSAVALAPSVPPIPVKAA
jgi:hypothetical protein